MPYKKHEELRGLSPNTVLWRYLKFWKFKDLIQRNSLFFSSPLKFEDPYDGFPSKLNCDIGCNITVMKNGETKVSTYKETFGDQSHQIIQMKINSAKKMRQSSFVNCWHINEGESDSQWKIYGGDEPSLAIVTSFKNLCDSIIDSFEIYGSSVHYYRQNELTSEGNAFLYLIWKRWAYEHEKEFRLIYWDPKLLNIDPKDIPPNVLVSIDPIKMIEKIIISPYATQESMNEVQQFIANAGLTIPVTQSDLLEPFFPI